MFDPRSGAPEHTSWTMGILAQLDHALGSGVMDKPMIALPEASGGSAQPLDSPTLEEIATGKYDPLFPGTTDKPSPVIARAAGLEGTFTFTVDVQPHGRTTNFAMEQGVPLLSSTMEKASHDWMFPKQAAGQRVAATVEFALNCHDPERAP
jgi:hypothetical protein